MKKIILTLITLASTIGAHAVALPFTEGFNGTTASTTGPEHTWTSSNNSTQSYLPQWRYDQHTYIDATEITPDEGTGLAYINFYDYTPQAEFYLTSETIDLNSASQLRLWFAYYHTGAYTAGIKAQIAFGTSTDYTTLYTQDYNASLPIGWQTVSLSIDVPAQATTAKLRFVATNGSNPSPIAIDNIVLKNAADLPVVYPSSVTDFTAHYNKRIPSITLSMVAPTLSHASLGDVRSQPLDYISSVRVLRSIGWGSDYTLIHQFDNPTPGQTLTFDDLDLTTGGEYFYKALVYIDSRCDYGEYTESIMVGQIPADVHSVNLSSNHGQAPVTITFTAPDTDSEGDPLTSLQKIVITRYDSDSFAWNEIATLTTDLVPGQTYTLTDPTVQSGMTYSYRIVAHGSAGNSYGTTAEIFVGIDTPERPANLVATVTPQGYVHLTWDLPPAGVNGGFIDTSAMTYTVQRGNGYSDYDATPIATNITDRSFTDTTVYPDEVAVKYFVKATADGLTGFSAISNLVVVGPASTLPYEENFDQIVSGNLQPQHTTWAMTSSEPSSVWAFAEMAYFIMEGQVLPYSGQGLAYAYYGPYSSAEREDYLTSGRINVEGADNPQLSVQVYGVPGYDTALNISVSEDDGPWRLLRSLDYHTAFTQQGWLNVTEPLGVSASTRTVRLRFNAHKGPYSCSTAIDHIRVTDASSAIPVVSTDAQPTITVTDHTVTITDCNGPVMIVNAAGQTVYSAQGACSASLPKGVYIVKAEGKVKKIVI